MPASFGGEEFELADGSGLSSDGDVIDRVRDTLTTLENAPKFQTVPLWLAVMVARELLPLFPSQPSALTSGIIFGMLEVAAMVLLANMATVTLAFFAAMGAGRAAAKNIIAADIINTESTGNAFQRKWSEFKTRRDGQVRFGQSRELAAQHQRRWWRRLRRRRIYSPARQGTCWSWAWALG